MSMGEATTEHLDLYNRLSGNLRRILETIGLNRVARAAERPLSLIIDVAVANYRAVRGRRILAVIMDELAFWRIEGSASPDIEVFNALSPGLARTPGSMAIMISSVHKRSGLLYERIREFHGKDDPSTLAVMGTTLDFNPSHDRAIIERSLAQDPERFGAEYLSRWRDDIGAFIELELLDAAVDRGVTVRPRIGGVNYVASCDASGGRGDSFTAAIAHREPDGCVVLDALYERRSPFDPSVVVAEIAGLLREYKVDRITGDRYSASWVVEAFAKTGIRYVQSERERSAIYMDALPLFTSGRVRLLDDKRMVSQFANLERRILSTGRERVEPGPGHDDLANSCAIALTLVGADTAPVLIKYDGFLVRGAPYTRPVHHYHQFKSMAVSPDGRCALIHWRGHRNMDPQLVLMDYEVGYFSEKRFSADLKYLSMCFNHCGLRKVAAIVTGGRYDSEERDVVVDFGFAPIASRYVEAGFVKIGPVAHDKSTLATLGDALDFRIDRLSDPLNAAAVAGVVKLLHVE